MGCQPQASSGEHFPRGNPPVLPVAVPREIPDRADHPQSLGGGCRMNPFARAAISSGGHFRHDDPIHATASGREYCSGRRRVEALRHFASGP